MKKTLLNTLVVAALAGTAAGSYATVGGISGSSVEQLNAMEAAFDKKGILANAIEVDSNHVRVIVQLDDAPMAQFAGVNPMVSGLVADKGQKVNFESSAAVNYKEFLVSQQLATIAQIKRLDAGFAADYSYTAAFNGFAGVISKDALDSLAALPGVKAVYPDAIQHSQMDASLDLINAIDTWEKVGGKEGAGAGVKVAIVDSGIRPENPLFSGEGFTAPDASELPDDDYCSVDANFCNAKLIVARHAVVPAGFSVVEEEYDSPLGFNGHGTHVAGTAVGNYGVMAERDGASAEISGVAPAAYLMVYKGLYATPANPASSSGANSMLLSMLEYSLLDGADIVNNSWGGGAGGSPEGSPYADVFDAMNDAGVVTVFAAGNDGPGAGTIGCPGCSDAVLTVANTTTDRLFANEVTIEGDTTIGAIPAIFSGAVPVTEAITGPAVYAGEVEPENFEGCVAYADDTTFAGSVAVISRGACSFADKIANAEAAGATAVLIFNSAGRGEAPFQMGGLSPDQTIPSLMMPYTSGSALAELAASTDDAVNVTIGADVVRSTSPALADIMNDSSSRGPNGDPRFLKPNLAAPGTRIFSGESPDAPGHEDESFSFKGGTSMASPHVAGAAALLRQMHPDWSSQQIKSALVASSIRDVVKEDGVTPADNFDMGAGRLDVLRASTAELTYSDLSLVSADCFLTCDMSITVTNTSDSDVSVSPTVMFDDAGISASVSPADATLPAGASAEITLSVDVSTASTGAWTFGGINWTDGNDATTDYFVPVAVYPISSDEPSLFTTTVSSDLVAENGMVEVEAYANNQSVTGLISITGELDHKFDLNEATLSAVKNGNQEPVSFDADTNTIMWEGALNTASFSMTEDGTIGDLLEGFNLPRYLPMSWIGVTPVTCSSVCDDTTVEVSFNGNTITYLGKEYTSMQISSNGFVSLGTDSGSVSTYQPHELPGLEEPNNVIAPFWTDFDLDGTSDTDTGTGNIYAADLTTGHFVVEWENAQIWGVDGTSVNMQLWFDYDTGDVHFVYGDMSAPQYDTVVGAENSTGSVGITHAAVLADGVMGTMPGSNQEYVLSAASGDDISIQFAGNIVPATEYMDDMVYVDEDASATSMVLTNESDATVINTFTMESLSGDFRSFAPITIDKPALDASSVVVATAPANGTATVNDDGTITYTPNANYYGEDSFTYTVDYVTATDADPVTVGEGTVSVMVAGVQDAPVLTVSAPASVQELSDFTVTASATDADGDDVVITINGVETTSYTGTAPIAEEGSISVVITATDGIDTVTDTVSIRVNNKGGGSTGWLALLLVPVLYLRRKMK